MATICNFRYMVRDKDDVYCQLKMNSLELDSKKCDEADCIFQKIRFKR